MKYAKIVLVVWVLTAIQHAYGVCPEEPKVLTPKTVEGGYLFTKEQTTRMLCLLEEVKEARALVTLKNTLISEQDKQIALLNQKLVLKDDIILEQKIQLQAQKDLFKASSSHEFWRGASLGAGATGAILSALVLSVVLTR